MTGKLTRIPKLWFVECGYCQSSPSKDLHEHELRNLAQKLCATPSTSHILDFLNAELDRLDHANLNHNTQVEIITEIHEMTECDCRRAEEAEIQDQLRHPPDPPIPGFPQGLDAPADGDAGSDAHRALPDQRLHTNTAQPTLSTTPRIIYLGDTTKKEISKALKSTRHQPPPTRSLLERLTNPKTSKTDTSRHD